MKTIKTINRYKKVRFQKNGCNRCCGSLPMIASHCPKCGQSIYSTSIPAMRPFPVEKTTVGDKVVSTAFVWIEEGKPMFETMVFSNYSDFEEEESYRCHSREEALQQHEAAVKKVKKEASIVFRVSGFVDAVCGKFWRIFDKEQEST